MRVIDADGEQLGVLTLREALNAARERGLDLVEVAPNADPPVCKILDYGKYQYLQMKKHRESRKSQKVTEVKEMRLRPKTDDYHQGFKVKQARRFLEAGMKVKVRIQFRGREITHPEIGREQLREVEEELSDIAVVEQRPNMEGRSMLMVMAPIAPGTVHHPRAGSAESDQEADELPAMAITPLPRLSASPERVAVDVAASDEVADIAIVDLEVAAVDDGQMEESAVEEEVTEADAKEEEMSDA